MAASSECACVHVIGWYYVQERKSLQERTPSPIGKDASPFFGSRVKVARDDARGITIGPSNYLVKQYFEFLSVKAWSRITADP